MIESAVSLGNDACDREAREPRTGLALAGLLALLMATTVVALAVGKFQVGPVEVLQVLVHRLTGIGRFEPGRLRILENVILSIRLPRIAAAALVGAALSVAGATYQSVLVNPMVSPKILGVTQGASFGAAIGIVYFGSWQAVQISAFLGGVSAMAIAVGLAALFRMGVLMLVLSGIVSGALFYGLLAIVQYLADPSTQLPALIYWMLGNLSLVDRLTVTRVAVPILLAMVALLALSQHMDILGMGDEEARALGVNVNAVRLAAIACATLASSLTVVVAGALDWVGIIVPHIARLCVGPGNRKLLPASALLGASYVTALDAISRSLFEVEIPIGILTALVGVPFFALVLGRARKGWK